jgi:hypothetical protein
LTRSRAPGSGQRSKLMLPCICRLGAGHDGLDGVDGGMDAACCPQGRPDPAREDGQPAEPQEQFTRAGQVHAHDVELLDVDVGLVEAIEQHQRVGVQVVQLLAKVRQRRVEGGDSRRGRCRQKTSWRRLALSRSWCSPWKGTLGITGGTNRPEPLAIGALASSGTSWEDGAGGACKEASKNYVQGERGAGSPGVGETGGGAPPPCWPEQGADAPRSPKLFLDDS